MLKKILLSLVLLVISFQLYAMPRQVPLLFAYQSTLIDEGGNLLPDGFTDVNFKILDSIGTVLYEETQNTYIDKGVATVMIGNGLNPLNGSPTGGIPTTALDPTDTKFLLVEVPGYKPYDKVEIVSAPYAIWADTAMKMPDGAITSAMLGKGIITKDHLDAELKEAIFPNGIPKAMLPADTLYGAEMQGSSGASKVGVDTAFIYSSSQTVQGVLKDLDIAINKRRQEIDYIQTSGTLNNSTIVGGTISDTTEISSPSIAPIGSIIPFYDFGGKATFNSNYWKYCDGSVYDFGGAIGVQTLPDLSGRYLVGYGDDGAKNLSGASWDSSATGNINNIINLAHSHTIASESSHTHTGPNHSHTPGSLQFKTLSTHDSQFYAYNSSGAEVRITNEEAGDGGGSRGMKMDQNTTYNTGVGSGATGLGGAGVTSAGSAHTHTEGSALSSSQSIQPRSVRVRYIIRVK